MAAFDTENVLLQGYRVHGNPTQAGQRIVLQGYTGPDTGRPGHVSSRRAEPLSGRRSDTLTSRQVPG